MKTLEEILAYPYDPWLILGVSEDTGDDDIRTAWKQAGAPETGIIADAFALLENEHARLRTKLLGPWAYRQASDALNSLEKSAVYLGPGAWYKAIQRRMTN